MSNDTGIAVVFLQPDCNMCCRFCVTEDGFDVMSSAAADGLLQTLRARGFHTVTLGGGEPFAWPGDVLALAARAKELGFCVQIGTNGIAVPEDFAAVPWVDRYVLPLESVDAAVHDGLRRYRGQHHRIVLDRLRRLQQAGRSVTVSTVVTSANRSGLPQLARFLADYHAVARNVHAWHLYRLLPHGRGGAVHGTDLQVASEDYRAACDAMQALGLPFAVFRRQDMYRSRTVEFFWSEDGRVVSGATAGQA